MRRHSKAAKLRLKANAMNLHDPQSQVTRDTQRTIWSSPLLGALILLIFTLLVRAISFIPSMINPDESIFALAAREVVNGHLPYTTLFDNKPVGSTLILALAFKLLGQSIFTVRLVGTLCVWLSAVLINALAQRGGLGRLQGLFAALFYIVFASTMGGFATLTEIILTPFTALAVLLLHAMLGATGLRHRLALISAAGLACGCAIAIKIVPVLPGLAVAALILLMLIRRRDLTIPAALVLGIAFAFFSLVPMALAAAAYLLAGELPTFLFSNFGFAGAYADIRPGFTVSIQRLATMADSLWPLLVLAQLAIGSLVASWRRGERRQSLLPVATVWLLGEAAAASAAGHFFPHYFLEAIPPLALLSAFGIGTIVRGIGAADSNRKAIALLCTIVVLIPLERTQIDAMRDLNAGPDVPRQIAAQIAKASKGRIPTLFVTNYQLEVLYSLTGSPLPPTRFIVAPHLFSRQSKMTNADPKVETARVLASRPQFIVMDESDKLPAWAQTQFHTVLATEYKQIYSAKGIHVYQSLDLERSQASDGYRPRASIVA